jgi:hypothetical protein
MDCVLTNSFAPSQEVVPSVSQPLTASGEENHSNLRNDSQVRPVDLPKRYIWRVEDFAGYELILVPEVECVFVDKEDDRSFVVCTVVNERDPEVRSRIYDRELAILDAHPGIDFEFNILSRRNRPLAQVMQSTQKPYKR